MNNHAVIRRGPTAADVLQRQFTQIYNAALRDARLSWKARGILAWLLSHRDGFGYSVPAIVAGGTDGEKSVRAGIKELTEHGYVSKRQQRDPDTGYWKPAEYWVTDMPEGITLSADPWENSRSAPDAENGNPDTPGEPSDTGASRDAGFRHAGYRHAGNGAHKKTTSKEDQPEESLSPRAGVVQELHQGEKRERESAAPETPKSHPDPVTTDADRVADAWAEAAGRTSDQWASKPIRREAEQLLAAGATVDYLTRAAIDMGANHPTFRSLTRHLEHYTPPAEKPVPDKCPKHPAYYRQGCVRCALEIPA